MSESQRPILIASTSLDRATWGIVAEELSRRGHEVAVYQADKVALGIIPMDIILNDNGLLMRYDNKHLYLNEVGAAWYRRSAFFSDSTQDPAKQIGLDAERKSIQASIWAEIPEKAWLNSPNNIQQADRKLQQLKLAHSLGFTVLPTVVSNQWGTILNDLPKSIVYKPSHPLLYENGQFKSVFTTLFQNDEETLPLTSNPFPGLWQAYSAKKREWRITVVGDESFDAAIYTSADAKDDWRKHQNDISKVTFRRETFPQAQKEKCFQYLGKLGLKFGAFDFIEDEEGQIVFLECNPNGQYGWLEQSLALPISKAIASELSRITKD